jgi:16S rRNA (guanine966-N2)-methyltransferase
MARKSGARRNPSPHKKRGESSTPAADGREAEVRIIGGEFRGRRLRYHGDPVVRPMKHSTREAIFNLVTTEAEDRHAVDLFAGTGSLGLEALSRGATSATFIEKHVPSARVVEENIRTLGVQGRATLLVTSAFLWAKRDLAAAAASGPTSIPWLVFCSPPYAFFVERQQEMLDLIHRIQQLAPPSSILVVEADDRFDFAQLTDVPRVVRSPEWSVRAYPPAVIGIWRGR